MQAVKKWSHVKHTNFSKITVITDYNFQFYIYFPQNSQYFIFNDLIHLDEGLKCGCIYEFEIRVTFASVWLIKYNKSAMSLSVNSNFA